MAKINSKIENVYSLTALQEGMLFHSLKDDDSTAYFIQSIFEVAENLNAAYVKKALNLLSIRYSVLRTAFVYEQMKNIYQVVLKERELDYEYIDLTDTENKESAYNEIISKEVDRGFDLKKDSLLRVKQIRMSDGVDRFVFSNHHIIMDGWCDIKLFTSFLSYFNDMNNGIAYDVLLKQVENEKNSSCDYCDYIKWLEKQDRNKAKEYWKNLIEGYDSESDLKAMQKPEDTEEQVDRITKELDITTTGKLKKLTESTESTINTAAETAVGILLQKYNRSDDVIFGKVVSGRNAPIDGISEIIGLFINTVPVRVTSEKNTTVTELLKKQQKQGIESTNYDYYSLAEIQNMSSQGSKLINVLYVFENYSSGVKQNVSKEDQENKIQIISAREQTNYGITIIGYEKDKKLSFDILYNPNDYCKKEIEAILERLVNICRQMAENPERLVKNIQTVTEEEKQLILETFNATATEKRIDKTVVKMFEEQVQRTPDATALVFENDKITYAEMNKKANVIANRLREMGVKPNDCVAIISDRNIEMIVGIYGIIKSGGAYVPIDPTYPDDRIIFMLEDSHAKVVLKNIVENVSISDGIPVIDLSGNDVWEGLETNPEHINNLDDILYCIYTSGTTGNPKGVMQTNRTIVNLVNYEYETIGVENFERTLFSTNYGFDVSAQEYFTTLLCGGTGIIITLEQKQNIPECIEKIRAKKVKVIFATPSYFEILSAEGTEALAESVTDVILAGESFKVSEKFLKSPFAGKIIIHNHYGPTETHVVTTKKATVAELREIKTLDLGIPIANTQIYVMNDNILCGIGIPGELCIAGYGIARGYLNRPELTEEKFVKNLFGEGTMYRSGDLARWLPDGNIEYLGRIDEQVKIRGFRIELGEIESKIREIEMIKDCAVIAKTDSTGDKAIYAYYTSGYETNASDIRDSLSESLPYYMIPAYIMQIETIPVTRNGKLDKCALPEIETRITREYIEPRNKTEEKICSVFSEILGIEKVGIKDNFFELGGHSLRATRLVNRIETETGTRIALKEVFNHPTPEQLAVLVGGEAGNYKPIPKAETKEYYPMSSAQKRVYLIQQMQPNAVTYNMPHNMKLTGKVGPEALKSALQQMTDRHEILRTSFLIVNGEPVQQILNHVEADFEYVASERDDEILIDEYIKPFDLSSGKLVRIKLVNKGEYHLLMLDMHHIISDGMSANTFTRELVSLYNGEQLEPLTHQFKDYSEWMRTRNLNDQANYWRSQFEDEISVLNMPTDYPRPPEQSYDGALKEVVLDDKLSASIKSIAKINKATDYMVFLAVAMITLSKYSRQEDIVIGSPISGRTHRDTEGMIGMFVNTLAMRGKPVGTKTFNIFLNEIKETCMKAYENQDYPFEELVEIVDVRRDMSRNPLFDVMLVLQNNESSALQLGESKAQGISDRSTIAKFDLTFNVAEFDGRFRVIVEYCTAIFKADTIERLMKHFIEVIKSVTTNCNKKINEIEMLTEEEKSLILNEFNATETNYPIDKSVAELFEEQVNKTPDNIALVFENEKLTYAELNAKANSLAYKLRECEVKPDDFVAIIADKSIEIIAGICGIIKAGAAYVPIDPAYPNERINFIIEDCKPKAVLKYTTESINITDEIPVIDLRNEEVWGGVSENPKCVNKSDELIYCIYTSGTTGNPKGSMIEHKNVVRLVKETNYIELSENTAILQTGLMSFDASTLEVWGGLLNGGKLVIAAQEVLTDKIRLKELIEKENVNTMWLTSSLFNQMIGEKNDTFDGLEHLLIGGEKLSDDHVRLMKNRNNGLKLTNGYGPTENTTFTTTYDIPSEFEIIPIGKPIANTKVYIMNGDNLCGIGVPGELCITGDGLARGYLNRPELTAEKFVKNPFGSGKMYHSGDLARWMDDGNIEYLGRIDEQVKIRGFRIELGEIESRIREIESVKDCAVAAKKDSAGDKAIYAYYTSDKKIDVTEIRDILSEVLPEYMIPAYMMQIESLPVTRNGKIDKRALPDIEVNTTRVYIAPENSIQAAICEAFSNILNVERVGINDSFFELGGDSIKAIRIITELRNAGYVITVKEIMNGKTAKIISSIIKKTENAEKKYEQSEVNGKIEKTPIIRKFEVWNLAKPEYFNQALMLNVSGISNSNLRLILEEIVKHHDMLRAVYRNNEVEILSIKDSKLFDFYEFDYTNESDKQKAIEEKCTEIQGSIDLENGPIVKAAVFKISEEKVMMLSIHHIAVDGVSWRIITEDFDTAVNQMNNGEKIKLPEKTASFIQWSRELKEYSEQLSEKEKDYWSKTTSEIKEGKLPGGYDETEPGKSEIEFDEKVTEILQKQSGNSCGAQIDEVILSGLARAIGKITSQKKLSVYLECHGREEIHKPINIDRTVGWFTNIYAVNLKICYDNRKSIIEAKEAVRRVPNAGMGYGYCGHIEEPDIVYNFFGDMGTISKDDKIMYSCGVGISKDNKMNGKILITGMIFDGKLRFIFESQENEYGQKFIDELSKNFVEIINELAEFCAKSDANEKTASDYGLNELTTEEFDEFMNKTAGEVDKIYGLTPLQKGMLFHNLEDTESTGYVVQSVYQLNFDIDVENFRKALHYTSCRYDVLRTSFIYDELITPKQVVYKEKEIEFEVLESTGNEFEEIIKNDVKRGFDLEKDSMIRVKLIHCGNNKNIFIMTIHHIIVDGWCLSILYSKIFEYYERIVNGNEKEVQSEINRARREKSEYSQYLEWISNHDKSEAREYWKNLLDGYDSECDIKAMKNPEPTEEQVNTLSRELDVRITNKLKKIVDNNEITINVLAETTVGILLQNYNSNNDIIFGKVVSGRNAPIDGIDEIIGLFINTVPVRVITDKETTALELMRKLHEQGIESSSYEYYSLADIQSMSSQGSKLINVLYVFENYLSGTKQENPDGASEEKVKVISSREQTNYDITITGMEEDGKLVFRIMYDPNKYCNEEIQLIMDRLVKICTEIANNPDAKVFELETVTESEKEFILHDYNATDKEITIDSLENIVHKQCRKTPNKVAVIKDEKEITYGELWTKAEKIAGYLHSKGYGRNDSIAIKGEREIETIENIIGILVAGCSYVPENPEYPEERNKYIEDNSRCRMCLDSQSFERENMSECEPYCCESDPDSIAYTIYTSGSTGVPKGVVIKHSAAVNTILDINEKFSVNENSAIIGLSAYSFDLSVYDIFGALSTGAKLVIVSDQKDSTEINDILEKHHITFWNSVPAIMSMYLLSGGKGNNVLKNVLMSGDWIPITLTEQIKEEFPNAELCSLGGATEGSIWSIYYPIKKIPEGMNSVPYGMPLANQKMLILNESGKICPIGAIGEICIAGKGVAEGYANSPEKTAKSFVEYDDYGRIYRTGDMGRMHSEGFIEFLGRIDDQVKIRGFRVEVGEIESRIRDIENIKDCAVIAKADSTGDKAIYAYYTSDVEVSISEIKEKLSETLPEYMLPSYMMRIDKIPVTRNGKLDKRALPEIEARAAREYEAPRNELEKKICAIFSEILNVEHIGIKDSFFELGGHSLFAVNVTNRLKKCGYNIRLQTLLHNKTPEKIANAIENGFSNVSDSLNEEIDERYYVDNIDVLIQRNSVDISSTAFEEYKPVKFAYNFVAENQQHLYCSCFIPGITYSLDKVIMALKTIIKEQGVLRSYYDKENDLILQTEEFDWDLCCIKSYSPDILNEFASGIEKYTSENTLIPMAYILIQKSDNINVYVLMDHIASDGYSCELFKTRFNEIINGKTSEHSVNPYSQYAIEVNRKNPKEYIEFSNGYYDEFISLAKNSDVLKGEKYKYIEVNKYVSERDIEIFNNAPIAKLLKVYFDILKMCNPNEIMDHYLNAMPINVLNAERDDENRYTIGLYVDTIPAIYNYSTSSIKDLHNTALKGTHYEVLSNCVNLKSMISVNYILTYSEGAEEDEYVICNDVTEVRGGITCIPIENMLKISFFVKYEEFDEEKIREYFNGNFIE